MIYRQNFLKESESLISTFDCICIANNLVLRLYPPVSVNTCTTIRTTLLPIGGSGESHSSGAHPQRKLGGI
jgi:hypothetical protein